MSRELRLKWLGSLASLTYPASPGQAAEGMKAYLPMLADLPDAAFTQRSLEAVVMAPRRMAMPSYDEVRKPLSDWWRENRPRVPSLPSPAPDRHVTQPPTQDELNAVTRSMTAWRQFSAELQESDAVKGGKPQPRHLHGDQLRAAYERQGLQVPGHLR